MQQMMKQWLKTMRTWLFFGVYSLALLGFGWLVIGFRLPDSLMIIFTIPIIFAAFYVSRWTLWAAIGMLMLVSLWVTQQISSNFQASLRTILIVAVCEIAMIEVVHYLTQLRHTAEKNLRASEQKYKSLVEQIPIGVYRTDHEGTFLHANHILAKMLGFENPEALILKYKAQDFCVDPTCVERQRQNYKVDHINIHELELRCTDDRRIWVRDTARAIFNETGDKIIYVDGTLEDITERKLIKEELESERGLLRTLIDNLPDRVYVKNLQGQKVLSNPADWEAIGVASDQEVLGKTDFDFMPPELASRFWADDEQVMKSGTPLINRVEPSPSILNDDRWILTTKVPLRDSQGKIIGLMGVGRDITERRHIEEALHKANEKLTEWVNELEQRNREARLLNDMGEMLQSCHSVEDAYEIIAQFGSRISEQQSGALYIINNSRNLMEIVVKWGEKENLPFGESVAKPEECWALRRGRVHLVTSAEDRMRCKHLQSEDEEKPKSVYPYICVPMVAQGETLGMMHVRFTQEKQAKGSEQLVIAIAERAAMALANLKLSEILRAQAVRDPLTGLFNRRYMEETFDREIRRAIRYRRPLGVIMLDIDHFKQFNDTFSYAAGDTLLRELGITLKGNVRADDVICRYGGEEFVIIMPESSLDDTARKAEQLRLVCKSMHIEHRSQPLGMVTVSLGVSAYPEHGQTAEELVRAVDTALHSAKSGGRDQVTIAEFPTASQ